MIRKIVLNIRHSDDYTDYLLMTSALTDKRVVPLLDPNENTLQLVVDAYTLVLRCEASNGEPKDGRLPGPGLSVSKEKREVVVFPKYYYNADGSVDSTHAELVRSQLNDTLHTILYCTNNINKLYICSFPFLWENRKKIYDNPQFFSVFCGRHMYRFGIGDCMTIGSVMKAMEENSDVFLLKGREGCKCNGKAYLIDYKRDFSTADIWIWETWCPCCQSRQTLRSQFFERAEACDWAIYSARKAYDEGESFSNLSLFDVLDALKSA